MTRMLQTQGCQDVPSVRITRLCQQVFAMLASLC
jgi:hypothetical protein